MKRRLLPLLLCAAAFALPGRPAAADDAADCGEKTGPEAVAACTRAIEARALRGEELAKIYYYRGIELADAGETDRAIDDFERSIDIDRSRPHVFEALAAGYRVKGDYDRALAIQTEAIGLEEDEPNGFFHRAGTHMERGDFEAAIADYTRAIALDPQEADFYNARGVASAAAGDFDLAIDDYGFALDRRPEFALALLNRGDARLKLGARDDAMADYSAAAELDPDDPVAVYKRANLHREGGDIDAALADYARLTELAPEESDAFYERAVARMLAHDLDGAVADFGAAIGLEPTNAAARQGRGLAHQARGATDAAIADYSEAIRLDPENAERYLMRAWASHKAGRNQLALVDADQAALLAPQLVSVHSTRAAILAALGEADAAREAEAAAADARGKWEATRAEEAAATEGAARARLEARAAAEQAFISAFEEKHPYSYPLQRAAAALGYPFEGDEIVEFGMDVTARGREAIAAFQRQGGMRGTAHLDEPTFMALLDEPVDVSSFELEQPWGVEGEPAGDWFFSVQGDWCTIWTKPTSVSGRFMPDFGKLPLFEISRDRTDSDRSLSQTYAQGELYPEDAEVEVRAGETVATSRFAGDYGPVRNCDAGGCSASSDVLKAVRAAQSFTVVGPSILGGELAVTYSASGFTKAFRRLDKECARGRLASWID